MNISICIPYKQRLANLTLALEGLTRQTMSPRCFEVVIGAMDESPELVGLVRRFPNLSIRVVRSTSDFTIPRARNLAMRQARGDVIVQMDADTLLAPDALAALHNGGFAHAQRQCVVGQVAGYDNNQCTGVEETITRTVDEHLAALHDMGVGEVPPDPRFQGVHHVPWMLAWTGLVAIPRKAVVADDLYFDEGFAGWGVDDLEWGYRVARTGMPIVLRPEVLALHLPHERDRASNDRSERVNYRRFLRKWPAPDVELASAIGDLRATTEMPSFQAALHDVLGDGSPDQLVAVRASVDGQDVLHLGVRMRTDGSMVDLPSLDRSGPTEVLSLVGISLPYLDGEIEACVVHPTVANLPSTYRDLVYAEATRVSAPPLGGDPGS